ncbi:MAG: zinc-ribbon domain-containing protein [Deltaproteobacteria bacterium]|nr:zinc-ribbon domain-containing protein [Deltaproteobacteria bacterium]
MIVECPRCRARYRVEAELLEHDQTFKCSRCSHVFAYEVEEADSGPVRGDAAAAAEVVASPPPALPPGAARGEARKPEARDERSLSFRFSSPEDPSRGLAEPEGPDEVPAAPPPLEQPAVAAPPPSAASDFSFRDDEEEPPLDPPSDDDEDLVDEPRFVRGEDELRIQPEEAHDPTRSYLVFLAVLVIVYAIFTLDLLNHPARAEKLLAGVPLVGDVLAQDHLLQIKVQLQDVAGAYQQIKDDRTVFVVSGRAVNTSSEPLKGVQIESALYDGEGKPIETKSIYCGNAMSLKIVKDLSSKEISLLQRLEPPKRFEIRPGESAGFSVVFLMPPPTLKEFTTRVLSAQSSLS